MILDTGVDIPQNINQFQDVTNKKGSAIAEPFL
jgi:hypothetical protein